MSTSHGAGQSAPHNTVVTGQSMSQSHRTSVSHPQQDAQQLPSAPSNSSFQKPSTSQVQQSHYSSVPVQQQQPVSQQPASVVSSHHGIAAGGFDDEVQSSAPTNTPAQPSLLHSCISQGSQRSQQPPELSLSQRETQVTIQGGSVQKWGGSVPGQHLSESQQKSVVGSVAQSASFAQQESAQQESFAKQESFTQQESVAGQQSVIQQSEAQQMSGVGSVAQPSVVQQGSTSVAQQSAVQQGSVSVPVSQQQDPAIYQQPQQGSFTGSAAMEAGSGSVALQSSHHGSVAGSATPSSAVIQQQGSVVGSRHSAIQNGSFAVSVASGGGSVVEEWYKKCNICPSIRSMWISFAINC